jgi:hypothetical protein
VAATIGLVQNETSNASSFIHRCRNWAASRPLAFVSVSVAMFHLPTHAFFKAMLFLWRGIRDPRDAPRTGICETTAVCAIKTDLPRDDDRYAGDHWFGIPLLYNRFQLVLWAPRVKDATDRLMPLADYAFWMLVGKRLFTSFTAGV